MRILLINPNTSKQVTEQLRSHIAQRDAEVAIDAETAAFGETYISSESAFAVAAHAVLDVWNRSLADAAPLPAAVLIGCFGDPGIFALREQSPVPVTGLAEASFRRAADHGPFAVVTGGAAWKPILMRQALSTGFATQLSEIVTVEATGAELAADPVSAHQLLRQACQKAAQSGAASIIVGGAGLAGIAARLQPYFDIPLIDSVTTGAEEAFALARKHAAVPASKLTQSQLLPAA